MDLIFSRQSERIPVTAAQQSLIAVPARVNRADRMYYMPRLQPVSSGNLSLPCFTSSKLPAFFKQSRPCGSMNRSVHASAAKQASVGRIDYGIALRLGYISNFYKYFALDARHIHKIKLLVDHVFLFSVSPQLFLRTFLNNFS